MFLCRAIVQPLIQFRLSGIRGLAAVTRLSRSETVRALQPLYFAVHPDLGGYDVQRQQINEESLKILNSYLDALQTHQKPRPVDLQFYIYRLRQDKHQVIPVSLTLRSHSLNETISYILKKCGLEEKLDRQLRNKVNEKETEPFSTPTLIIDDWDNIFTTRRQKKSTYNISDTAEWIKNVVKYAREKQTNTEPIVKENNFIKSQLCLLYYLADIHMHDSWSALTKHGYLISLKKLFETNNNLWSKVSSVIDTPLNIRVGYINTVTYNRHLCLHSEDTHQLWIQFLTRVANKLDLWSRIHYLVTLLSANLGDVVIDFDDAVNPTIDHYHWLRTCLNDAKFVNHKNQFLGLKIMFCCPSLFSSSHSLGSEGFLSMPLGTPLQTILQHLKTEGETMRKKTLELQRSKAALNQTVQEVQTLLGLSNIRINAQLTDAQLIHCLRELRQLAIVLPHTDLSGIRLALGYHHGVSEDGELVIPWKFEVIT